MLLLCLSHAVVFFDSSNRGKKQWIVKNRVAAPLCPKIVRHSLVPDTFRAGGTSVVLRRNLWIMSVVSSLFREFYLFKQFDTLNFEIL